MNLNIVVRTDVAWDTMTYDRFVAQLGNVNLIQGGKDPARLLELIKLWEQAYNLDYFKYRAALKRACRRELDWSGDTVTVGGSFAGNVLIPVDDDDVIFPDVKMVSKYFEVASTNVVCWNRCTVVHGEYRSESGRWLDTCNWAIRTSYLSRWGYSDINLMLQKHQFAHKMIGQDLGLIPKVFNSLLDMRPGVNEGTTNVALNHPSVVCVEEDWSAYYLHSGSISFLAHKMKTSGIDIVGYLRSLPLHPMFDMGVYNDIRMAS